MEIYSQHLELILISCSDGLRSCKCCLILGNISASTQNMGTTMYIIKCVVLSTNVYSKKKLRLTNNADPYECRRPMRNCSI